MHNPFEAPRASLDPVAEDPATEALAIRRANLAHEERLLRSGSWLVFIGTSVALFALLRMSVDVRRALEGVRALDGLAMGYLVLLLAMGAGYVVLGLELLALRGERRLLTAAACVPVLVAFPPVGTWIAIRMMHALLSEKGATVLSPSYRGVRAATPEIKLPTFSWVVPFVGALVVFGVLWLVAAAMRPWF